MLNLKKLLLAALWWAAVPSLMASAPPAAQVLDTMRFQRLLTGERPSDTYGIGAVLDIIQDDTGYVWVAGENGLARYNAHTFAFYHEDAKNPKALANNWVADLEIDHDGVLWAATANGLSRYNRLTDDFTTYRPDPENANSVSYDLINALAVDQQNNLLIGTGGGGLSMLNDRRDTFTHLGHDPNDPGSLKSDAILDLYIGHDQTLWVGYTGSGLSRFDADSGRFNHWQHSESDPTSLAHNAVQRIAEDSRGRLWVGTYGGGLSRLRDDGKGFHNYAHAAGRVDSIGSNVIRDIHNDSRGNLWVATDHGGLALYDPENDGFLHLRHHVYDRTTLLSDQLRKVYEDKAGNLWIGAVPTGVNFYDISMSHFKILTHKPGDSNSLSHNGVLTLFEDSDGMLWIGTENGLNAYDRATGTITRYTADPTDPGSLRFGAVTSIEEDADGKLWVGTWSGGLHLFDRHTGKFKNYFPKASDPTSLIGPHIWHIVRDHGGDIWMAATQQGGLSRYVRETDSFIHYHRQADNPNSLANDHVWVLLPDRRGNLWVGTQSGLDYFSPKTEDFTHYRHGPRDPTTISNHNVLAIIEDRQGMLWIGTEGGGVNLFDPSTGIFRAFSVAEGLPSGHVATLVEDHAGDIWAGTSHGLARIKRDTFAIKVLRKSDGLAGSTINRNASFVDANGDLYIGSTEGVSIFNPADLIEASAPPKVVLTELRVLNQPVAVGEPGSPLQQALEHTNTLVLSHKDSMFAFDFAALSFNSANQTKYAYMLEGFDRAWNNVGTTRTATYTNLDPGTYTFRVKAANSAGVWSTDEAQVMIAITPPWWRTWWAYAFYVALLAFAVYLRKNYISLRRRSDEYRVLSTTDALTGLLNRTGVLQVVATTFASLEERQNATLMLFDIDHFKRVNDVRGHDAGDRILKSFAQLIAANVRIKDSLARWGGEEFLLLCKPEPLTVARGIAEELRQAVAGHVFEEDLAPLRLTVSIGVASLRPDENFEQLFKRADIALYEAKASGRNCVVVAEGS